MDRAAHRTLDVRISKLLAQLQELPSDERGEVQHYLDHDEYGLAFERLIDAVADCGVKLGDDQVTEVNHLAGLMGLPPPGFTAVQNLDSCSTLMGRFR